MPNQALFNVRLSKFVRISLTRLLTHGGCLIAGLLIGLATGPKKRSSILEHAVIHSSAPVVHRDKAPEIVAPTMDEIAGTDVRAQTLAEMKRRGMNMSFSVIAGESFNMQLALVLGITVEEMDRMDRRLKEARAQIVQQQLAVAIQKVSEDGKTKVVTIPPTADGAAIYNSLLSQIESVLGHARYELFSQISGDQFDSLYDHFGADTATYEITLAPEENLDGNARYDFKRSQSESSSGTKYWSTSSVTKALITDPLLKPFLPEDSK